MADRSGPKPPEKKAVEVRKTREELEHLGLPDDHTPEPQHKSDEEAPATGDPDQGSVQTGGPVIKDKLRQKDQE